MILKTVLSLTQRIAGIDEAGRGPVIGPLVIAGVVIDTSQLDVLKEWGVKDSKQLTPKRREELEQCISQLAQFVEVLEIPAREIDTERQKKRSLNVLEAEWMANVLNRLSYDIAYVDASDVNAERYGSMILAHLIKPRKVVSEHKADSSHLVVSAASIVAKVRRDQRIHEFHQVYGDFGSGYPHDPKTRQFLVDWIKTYGSYPDIVRKSWITARSIITANHQQTLFE